MRDTTHPMLFCLLYSDSIRTYKLLLRLAGFVRCGLKRVGVVAAAAGICLGRANGMQTQRYNDVGVLTFWSLRYLLSPGRDARRDVAKSRAPSATVRGPSPITDH